MNLREVVSGLLMRAIELVQPKSAPNHGDRCCDVSSDGWQCRRDVDADGKHDGPCDFINLKGRS